MSKRPKLLVDRGKTHGNFADNAQISQILKEVFRERGNRNCGISLVHAEALDQIAMKLSRILSGHASFKDHWLDISGYALLAAESCDE
jgi:hypothetical protein